jgi:hypothetical protein
VKLDLKKELKHLYLPSAGKVSVVEVPEMQFAMIDGQIEPHLSPGDSPQFSAAVGALFGLSYTLKFVSKKRLVDPIDYGVMPLEGLWTTPQGGADYAETKEWSWTLMMMQPAHITPEMFSEALTAVKAKLAKQGKDGGDPAVFDRMRLESFTEGLCVQALHVGAYLDEPRTLDKMTAFASASGYGFHGRHHEIYMSDPRTAKADNLRTVLRHPVAKTK